MVFVWWSAGRQQLRQHAGNSVGVTLLVPCTVRQQCATLASPVFSEPFEMQRCPTIHKADSDAVEWVCKLLRTNR